MQQNVAGMHRQPRNFPSPQLPPPSQIYSWQGVNALELWARVLGAHAGKPELRPLVYPLVQVNEGVRVEAWGDTWCCWSVEQEP
jgi:hypothetical protein